MRRQRSEYFKHIVAARLLTGKTKTAGITEEIDELSLAAWYQRQRMIQALILAMPPGEPITPRGEFINWSKQHTRWRLPSSIEGEHLHMLQRDTFSRGNAMNIISLLLKTPLAVKYQGQYSV